MHKENRGDSQDEPVCRCTFIPLTAAASEYSAVAFNTIGVNDVRQLKNCFNIHGEGEK